MLKVAIGLMLLAGLGLAAYAPHLQHRFSFIQKAACEASYAENTVRLRPRITLLLKPPQNR
jgi:hypothetical protein